jgi:hypothetical protein
MSNIAVRGFTPTTLTEAMQFSELMAKSTMVPRQYQGKPEDILVACQWGAEIGLSPLQALQNIAVINGKPSVYGDAALALVQASPVCEDIEESVEGDTAICVAKRRGRKPVTAKFSVDDAKRAGLWGKQGPWTQYPKRMLQMRARGFALRDAFPDVLKGLITSEEAMDFPVDKPAYTASVSVSEPPVEVLPPPVEPAQVDLPFKLHLPGGDVYSQHATLDEFISAYAELVRRIRSSTKLSVEDQIMKVNDLREANESLRKRLSAADAVRLAAAIAGSPVASKEVVTDPKALASAGEPNVSESSDI